MKNKPDANVRIRRTYGNVSIVFFVLAISLQTIMWLYWGKVLEPRLRVEAASHANVLAHSQAVRLADSLAFGKANQRLQVLRETIDEILLFTGPDSREPLFLGLKLEIDYDVLSARQGSLDLINGVTECRNCFVSEVALYSPVSDELIGIARFHVSNSFFQHLSKDVRKTLFTQALLGTILLFIVWAAIILFIKEINRSRHQAEIANQAKSAFLANMSHELRTPLNAIIGFSELMGLAPDFSPKYRENLRIINRSGEYLLELINDVLELSKNEVIQDTLMETAFDLYDILDNVSEMIRLRVEKKNLQFIYERTDDLPRYIKTDERKLRQILLNLLGNAVKFTEKGAVTLRVGLENGNNTALKNGLLFIHFEVEDNGPGIEPEERAKIFDAFTQTRCGKDKKDGVGLGLAISRQFINHLGGEINVSSTIGKGTAFAFTIQAKPALVSEIESRIPVRRVIGLKSPEADGQNNLCRILVVDDHKENRALLCLLLEQVGFLVKTAKNGKQAVELNREWRPHLIWMDIRMPVMDGYEATEKIRQSMEVKTEGQPIIIALTANAFQEDRDAVYAAGCDDFVSRPFHQSEILDKINHHLGVDYIYETSKDADNSQTIPQSLSPKALAREIQLLHPGVVKELHTAIELSDMELMDQLVAEISIDNPPLAKELKELIDTFQYDRILRLLDKADEPTQFAPGEKQ